MASSMRPSGRWWRSLPLERDTWALTLELPSLERYKHDILLLLLFVSLLFIYYLRECCSYKRVLEIIIKL